MKYLHFLKKKIGTPKMFLLGLSYNRGPTPLYSLNILVPSELIPVNESCRLRVTNSMDHSVLKRKLV